MMLDHHFTIERLPADDEWVVVVHPSGGRTPTRGDVLRSYVARYGHCPVPWRYPRPEDMRLVDAARGL